MSRIGENQSTLAISLSNLCIHATTSPIHKLDTDVSYVITSMLAKKHLSSFMKTCYAIYHAGIPQLLSGDVSIHSYSALKSFYQFMFAEVVPSTESTTMARRNLAHPRFKFLHGLNIQLRTRPEIEPSLLVDIVRKSIELRRLTLHRCDETIFYLSTRTTRRIAEVLDALPVLQKLFLSETRELHTPIILGSFRRSTTSISELSLIIDSTVNLSSSSLALSSMANTLTKLTLNDQLLRYDHKNPPPDVPPACFPRVQELTILTKGIHVGRILGLLVQFFPSLKRLSFIQTSPSCTLPDHSSLQTLRNFNQADYFQRYRICQPTHGDGHGQNSRILKSLDSFSGEAEHLHALGMTIPIRQLSIRHCLDREQIELLRDVFKDVRPSILGLRLCGWDVLSGRLGSLRDIAGGTSITTTSGRANLNGIFLEVLIYDHDFEKYSAILESIKVCVFGLPLLTIALEFTYRLKTRRPMVIKFL